MARLPCRTRSAVLVLMLLTSPVSAQTHINGSGGGERPDTRGVFGVVNGNLVLTPPEGGAVYIDGTDWAQTHHAQTVKLKKLRDQLAEIDAAHSTKVARVQLLVCRHYRQQQLQTGTANATSLAASVCANNNNTAAATTTAATTTAATATTTTTAAAATTTATTTPITHGVCRDAEYIHAESQQIVALVVDDSGALFSASPGGTVSKLVFSSMGLTQRTTFTANDLNGLRGMAMGSGALLYLVSDRTVRVITAATFAFTRSWSLNSATNDAFTRGIASVNGRWFYTALSSQPVFQAWNLSQPSPDLTYTVQVDSVIYAFAFCDNDPGRLYIGTHNGDLSAWDTTQQDAAPTLTFRATYPSAGNLRAIVCYANHVYAGYQNGLLLDWDLGDDSAPVANVLSGHTGDVMALALRGSRLFSASVDSTIRVWDIGPPSHATLVDVIVDQASTHANALAVHGKHLYAGRPDGIHVYDLESCPECSPGTKQVHEPTASTDRMCVDCEAGRFAEAVNSPDCQLWTDCLPGTEVVGAPTSTSDRSCASCLPGTYSDEANAPSCVSCSGCGSCPLSDAACVNCVFQDETGQTQCKHVLDCGIGHHVAVHPTASSDRVCALCDQGTYSDSTNAPNCRPHSDCQPGEGVVTGPSVTSDRKCGACQTGFYSNTANVQCVSATICEQHEIEWVAPTPSSDRQCIPCYDDRLLNCDAIELAGFVHASGVNQIYYKHSVSHGAPVFLNAETELTLTWASGNWQVNDRTAERLAFSPQCDFLNRTSLAPWYRKNHTEPDATALCVDNNSPVRPLRCEPEQAVAVSGDERVTGYYFADELEGASSLVYESTAATLLWEQDLGWVIRSKPPLQDLAFFPGVDPLEGDWPEASTWRVYGATPGQSGVSENPNIKARCETVMA